MKKQFFKTGWIPAIYALVLMTCWSCEEDEPKHDDVFLSTGQFSASSSVTFDNAVLAMPYEGATAQIEIKAGDEAIGTLGLKVEVEDNSWCRASINAGKLSIVANRYSKAETDRKTTVTVTSDLEYVKGVSITVVQEPEPKSSAAQLSSFTIANAISVDINESTGYIQVLMPRGTDVTALTPTFSLSDNATVSPTSGTVQDFTNPVTYIVTAEDGITTKTYTVCVTVEKSTEAFILGFTLPNQIGESSIDQENGLVAITLLPMTKTDSLAPTITVSEGATISPESGITQNFSVPVTYTVTAEDGVTTRTYTVTVTVEDVKTGGSIEDPTRGDDIDV